MRALDAREQLANEVIAEGRQKSLRLDETLKAHEKQLAAMMEARGQQLVVKVTSKTFITYPQPWYNIHLCFVPYGSVDLIPEFQSRKLGLAVCSDLELMQEQRMLAAISERERRCTEVDLQAKQAQAAAAEESARASHALQEAADRLQAAERCKEDVSTSRAALQVVTCRSAQLQCGTKQSKFPGCGG